MYTIKSKDKTQYCVWTILFSPSESNLKLLASLEITPKKAPRSVSSKHQQETCVRCLTLTTFLCSGRSTTLAELFVPTYGRTEITAALIQGRGLSAATPLHPHWGALAPMITNSLLRALYPSLCIGIVAHYCIVYSITARSYTKEIDVSTLVGHVHVHVYTVYTGD